MKSALKEEPWRAAVALTAWIKYGRLLVSSSQATAKALAVVRHLQIWFSNKNA